MIENPKIADLRPDGTLFERWKAAEAHGVSLLYTPPGRSIVPDPTVSDPKQWLLHCDLADPRLALYSGLSRTIPWLDGALRDLWPCWVTPTTYHSTFANSLNDFNLDLVDGSSSPELRKFIRDLPTSLNGNLPPDLPPARVEFNRPWRVRFRFGGLHVWPKAFALVALLEPADEESQTNLDALHAIRETLNQHLVNRGMPPDTGPVPHITLCYFATEEQARRAKDRITDTDLRHALSAALHGLVVEHGSIGLYGWTSMVDFWPHRLFGDWKEVKKHAAQTALVRSALSDPDHALDRLLRLMRENDQAALYLFGSRLDNDFCLGSKDLGALFSVLPEDGEKAGMPGYHPGSTEIYVTFQGQLAMDCLEPAQPNVFECRSGRDEILVLPPGRCHRVRAAGSTTAAALVVKTNLSHSPDVVRCEKCGYFTDPKACALHNAWRAEQRSASPVSRG